MQVVQRMFSLDLTIEEEMYAKLKGNQLTSQQMVFITMFIISMISKERITRRKGTIQYLLEAKIASYKLYDNSLISLIPKHGWLSDEVSKINQYK